MSLFYVQAEGCPVLFINLWLYLEPIGSSKMLLSKDADLAFGY